MRWSRTTMRATAVAAIAALGLTTVAGAIGLPGPALLTLVLFGTVLAVAAVLATGRERH